MVKASVPHFFICPISLQLMNDPVTLTTGQTYDRRSIEKWFAEGHTTCSSTMQVLPNMDIAHNYILQKLIQLWCASNGYRQGAAAVGGIPRVSSTSEAKGRPVMQMLREVATRGGDLLNNLKELKGFAKDLDQGLTNRIVLVEAGAVPILANFVFSPESLKKNLNACEEALAILTLLPLQDIRKLVYVDTKQLTTISWLLNRGTIDARVNAALLLASLAEEDNEIKASVGSTAGIFEGLIQLLKEELYLKAVEAGLKAILSIMSNGPDRNISRAVDAGVVFAVVDCLLHTERRSEVQTLAKLMDLICSSAEGREAATAHALVVPLLTRIILSDITVASESALSSLWTICQHSPIKSVDEAARQVGILMQLSHLVQSSDHQINPRTKQRAAELFRQLRHSLKNCSPRF